MTARGCAVEGCDRPLHGRGYCQPHLNRWRRHGDPLAGPPIRTRTDDPADGCPICEDLAWLLDTGEHPDHIEARLGIACQSLLTHLRRHRRADLRARLDQARHSTAA